MAVPPRSRSVSTEPDQDTARPLFRIAFQGDNTAHWALFLPYDVHSNGDPTGRGLIAHIGVEKEGSSRSGKANHCLRFSIFNHTTSTKNAMDYIKGSHVTDRQLREAAQAVFNQPSYNYRALTNNCQHFCIQTVTELHRRHPNAMSKAGLEDLKAKGTALTKIMAHRDRLGPPAPRPRTPPNAPPSGVRFDID